MAALFASTCTPKTPVPQGKQNSAYTHYPPGVRRRFLADASERRSPGRKLLRGFRSRTCPTRLTKLSASISRKRNWSTSLSRSWRLTDGIASLFLSGPCPARISRPSTERQRGRLDGASAFQFFQFFDAD